MKKAELILNPAFLTCIDTKCLFREFFTVLIIL